MNRRGCLRGFSAAMVGVSASEALTAIRGQPSMIDAVGQLVVDRGPRPVVEHTVRLLGTADKPVIRATVFAAIGAAGAVLGRRPRNVLSDVAAIGALAAAGELASRRPPTHSRLSSGVFPATAGALAAIATLWAPPRVTAAAGLGGALTLLAATRRHANRSARQDAAHQSHSLPVAAPLPLARDGAEHWPGVSPLHTPVEDFYVTDVAMRPPPVDLNRWRLAISGEVGRPTSLRYDELLSADLLEFDAAMVCIHNRLGWDRLGNQRWTGVPLAELLATAEPAETATALVTRSIDGWECSLPLDLLAELDAYLVLGMGGRPLTAAHGFPARVFVPGLYGQYTGAKWVTELRLQSEPNRDYWMPRGWPRQPAPVRPLSRIDAPAPRSRHRAGQITVTGVAWAPPVGVRGVAVAIDDDRWITAQLAAELAPAAWRRWRATVSLPPGPHILTARCIALDGVVQDAAPRPPFPTGTTGYHHVAVIGTDGTI